MARVVVSLKMGCTFCLTESKHLSRFRLIGHLNGGDPTGHTIADIEATRR